LNLLFHFDVAPLNLAFRAFAVYLVVLVLLRIGGKRQIGQMGATEFVAVLLISNAVQNSMNGGDNSLIGGLWLAGILIAMSTGISWLTYKSRFFSHLFEGTPTLLVHHGKVITKNLKREMLTQRQLREMLRHQGFVSLSEINDVILEADGTLTIVRSDMANQQITQAMGVAPPLWPDQADGSVRDLFRNLVDENDG
jgi:uncharacterized membrane protein YcaP (DUF421 family)